MKFTKVALLAAAISASLGVTAGAVNAAPAESDQGAINYATTVSETNTIIKTDAGSMVVEDGVFKVKAANGATVAGTELKFRVDDFEFPIAAEIADRTATLTPQFDLAHAVYKPVALPYENQAPWKTEYDREVAAWSRLGSTISLGASIATIVGGIGGAALGCIGGALVGAALTAPLALMFGSGPIAGCIAGAGAVGFLGTLAGQIFITAPVAILAAVQYFTTINQPMPNAAK
ncbi:hypothetical protein JK358_09715 [Nocardia sp. 2]|uniref:DUF8020 domain-containing protein n=1 Tax=Nocardia acididurans TaxID=2802282 RepID=A0ABS1M1Y0_9NOCA|nr:hypothetical protein [Nocardia acididurans]MBL1074673.1 hypothetical protein [Nocardia acididurans]